MSFTKNYQVYLAQIRRSLDKKHHSIFLILLTDMKIRVGNETEVTMTDMKIWNGSNNRGVFASFRSALERLGFWKKKKTNIYMVNPEVINNDKADVTEQLGLTYRAIGGKAVKFDDYMKRQKETTVVRNNQMLLDKEYKNAMNAALVKALREKDETIKEKDKVIKKEKVMGEALQKEMVEVKEQLKLIFSLLTPDQKKEAEPILKAVK